MLWRCFIFNRNREAIKKMGLTVILLCSNYIYVLKLPNQGSDPNPAEKKWCSSFSLIKVGPFYKTTLYSIRLFANINCHVLNN